jgi:hypothetical protein
MSGFNPKETVKPKKNELFSDTRGGKIQQTYNENPPTLTVHEAKQDDAAMKAGQKSNLGESESGTHKGIFQVKGESVGKATDQPEAPHGRSYPGRPIPGTKKVK